MKGESAQLRKDREHYLQELGEKYRKVEPQSFPEGDTLTFLFMPSITMECPHCRVTFHGNISYSGISGGDAVIRAGKLVSTLLEGTSEMWVKSLKCPSCKKPIIYLETGKTDGGKFEAKSSEMVYPKFPAPKTAPHDTPSQLASDYKEARQVLDISPKASAALSRRRLQALLRDHAKVGPGDLDTEVQAVLDSQSLPSQLANSVDSIRALGNIAPTQPKARNQDRL